MKLILVAFWMTVEASTQTVYFIIFDYISIQSLRIKPNIFLSTKEMKKLKHSSFYFFGDKKEKSLIEFFNLKRFRKKPSKSFFANPISKRIPDVSEQKTCGCLALASRL